MRPIAERTLGEPGVREYLASVGTRNERSVETYLSILGSIRERAGKSLLDLTRKDIPALVERLKSEKSYPQYVGRLKSFLLFHERGDLIKVLPKKLPVRLSPVGPGDILEMDELNGMLEAATSKRDRALLVALFETAGRIDEVLKTNIEDYARHENGGNDGRPWYRVWFKKTKIPGEQHYGYIRDSVSVAILDKWIADYPAEIEARPRPMFPSFAHGHEDQRLTSMGANKVLKAMAARAGISKNVHAHVMKHTRATHLLRQGVSEKIINRLLGWTFNSRMLGRYAHLVNEDVEAALGLSGEKAKPAELLLPKRDVPAMTELPFRTNPAKAVEMMRQELRKEVLAEVREFLKVGEQFKRENEQLKTMLTKAGYPNINPEDLDETNLD